MHLQSGSAGFFVDKNVYRWGTLKNPYEKICLHKPFRNVTCNLRVADFKFQQGL